MTRWEPDASQRLQAAALELFEKHGYEKVTVLQIAEHAGLTRRSFFRHFASKREVLFVGSNELGPQLGASITFAARDERPLPAALDAIRRGGTLFAQGLAQAELRQRIIDATDELRECERSRLESATRSIATALEERQVPALKAQLVAQLATMVFQNAFRRWLEKKGRVSFASVFDTVVVELRATLIE